MRVINRKSRWQRIKVNGLNPPKAVKSGLGAIGGVAALTAGSAAMSSLRRRKGSGNHS